MGALLLIGTFVVILFASAIFFGAPFLPTLRQSTVAALDLLDLKPGQTLYELGSGDGRILREAARRGINAVGYEINPLLVIYSKILSFKYRKLVKIRWRNFWHISLKPADAIYVFLLTGFMQKLDKKIQRECGRQIKVVTFAYAFPNRQAIKQAQGQMLYRIGPTK